MGSLLAAALPPQAPISSATYSRTAALSPQTVCPNTARRETQCVLIPPNAFRETQ